MAQLINPDLPIEYRLPSCDPIIVTARPMTTRGRMLTMQRLLPQPDPRPSDCFLPVEVNDRGSWIHRPDFADWRRGGKTRQTSLRAARYHRQLAEESSNPRVKAIMNRAADIYEEMAAEMDGETIVRPRS